MLDLDEVDRARPLGKFLALWPHRHRSLDLGPHDRIGSSRCLSFINKLSEY